jgi:hypothetical protein
MPLSLVRGRLRALRWLANGESIVGSSLSGVAWW